MGKLRGHFSSYSETENTRFYLDFLKIIIMEICKHTKSRENSIMNTQGLTMQFHHYQFVINLISSVSPIPPKWIILKQIPDILSFHL